MTGNGWYVRNEPARSTLKGSDMPQWKHGDFATYYSTKSNVEEMVVVDEVLDDGQVAVRFLDGGEVFIVHEDELSD